MPQSGNNIIDIFDIFDDMKSRKMMDILFYSVNWIRETISGFASQEDAMIKKKVSDLKYIEDFNIQYSVSTKNTTFQEKQIFA